MLEILIWTYALLPLGWMMALFGNFQYYQDQMLVIMIDRAPSRLNSWLLFLNDDVLNSMITRIIE